MTGVRQGDLLWRPPDELVRGAAVTRYRSWLDERRGLAFEDYHDLWRWSVADLEGFWSSTG